MTSVVGDLLAVPDLAQLARVAIRLGMAAVLGGILGIEREQVGKAAGLRTHMLVALGAALFTVAAVEAGMTVGVLLAFVVLSALGRIERRMRR